MRPFAVLARGVGGFLGSSCEDLPGMGGTLPCPAEAVPDPPPPPPGGAVPPAVSRRMLRAGSAGPGAAAAERRRWVRGYGAGGGARSGARGGGWDGVRAGEGSAWLCRSRRRSVRPLVLGEGRACAAPRGEGKWWSLGWGGRASGKFKSAAPRAVLGWERSRAESPPSFLPGGRSAAGLKKPRSPFPDPRNVGSAVGDDGMRGDPRALTLPEPCGGAGRDAVCREHSLQGFGHSTQSLGHSPALQLPVVQRAQGVRFCLSTTG